MSVTCLPCSQERFTAQSPELFRQSKENVYARTSSCTGKLTGVHAGRLL